MADRLDLEECIEFLVELVGIARIGAIRAGDELDGFEQAAGRFGFPDFAEPAGPQPLEQPVARDRLGVRFDSQRHARSSDEQI